MRANLSSLTFSIPTNPYSSPSLSNLHSTKPFTSRILSRKPFSKLIITSKKSSQENLETIDRKIGNTDPPWLVPAPPYNGEGLLFNHHHHHHHAHSSGNLPISLRLLQMRKKKDRLATSDSLATSADLGSIGRAVWSLNCLIEDLQLSALPKEIRVRVLRDGRYSMVWLFQKVFSGSPNLAVGLLDLTASFMVRSIEGMMLVLGRELIEQEVVDDDDDDDDDDYKCWSHIGILDESKKIYEKDDYMRKKMAYEEMIVQEKPNSMIFSNYAQLLYLYEKDYDRAKHYFECSVVTEPVDAEAMSRYALFLWHELGEMNMAEEMFLGAISEDPENEHHRGNYALFLWKTSGNDTCFPLNKPIVPKDGEAEVCDNDKEVQAESWSDIGIFDGSRKQRSEEDQCFNYKQKKMVYERMIINGKINSLILSNYAQLLYQYERDFDRANYYFNLAVTSEPLDAEAMSRYALFLWHERGDVEMAEEMFLMAADADPQNNHHQQNYAWFLWKTGGTDTCYPLDDCTIDNEEEEEDESDDKEATEL